VHSSRPYILQKQKHTDSSQKKNSKQEKQRQPTARCAIKAMHLHHLIYHQKMKAAHFKPSRNMCFQLLLPNVNQQKNVSHKQRLRD